MERVYVSLAAVEKRGFSVYFEKLQAFILVPEGWDVSGASPVEGTRNVYAVPHGYRTSGLYIKKGNLILMTDAKGKGTFSISLSARTDIGSTTYYVYPDGKIKRLNA